jgi:hypothetical protein
MSVETSRPRCDHTEGLPQIPRERFRGTLHVVVRRQNCPEHPANAPGARFTAWCDARTAPSTPRMRPGHASRRRATPELPRPPRERARGTLHGVVRRQNCPDHPANAPGARFTAWCDARTAPTTPRTRPGPISRRSRALRSDRRAVRSLVRAEGSVVWRSPAASGHPGRVRATRRDRRACSNARRGGASNADCWRRADPA